MTLLVLHAIKLYVAFFQGTCLEGTSNNIIYFIHTNTINYHIIFKLVTAIFHSCHLPLNNYVFFKNEFCIFFVHK
jgi:hypothetical protein